jgi:putative transposase
MSYTLAELKGGYFMPWKRFTPEQIIMKLREAEVLLSKGRKVGEVCRQLDVSENTYYRWRKEYGGLDIHQASRLKELEKENARLKKQRYKPRVADDEEMLVERIVALATQYGRYGYRRITALLRAEGWSVNHKRVERI